MHAIIDRLQATYNHLTKDNIDSDLLDQLYTDDIVFHDPLHQFQSLSKLRDYFKRLYKNVDHISFNYEHVESTDSTAFVTWKMTFLNKNFNKGQPVTVDGISHLKFRDGKICSHRDYFDSTHMIFDHIPVLGRVIQIIKNKL